MAMAVQELFPGAQVTIGPVIDNGFYYDFKYDRPFTNEDLARIEKRMEELSKQDLPVSRSIMSRDEAIKLFEDMGKNTRSVSFRTFPAMRTFHFTARAILSTCAAVPTFPAPAS